jgi:hypothetical protein
MKKSKSRKSKSPRPPAAKPRSTSERRIRPFGSQRAAEAKIARGQKHLSKLREAFSFRHFLIGIGIATIAALALRAFSGLPFWDCFVIVVVAMLVIGWGCAS